MMSNWTAASSDCSRPANNYVRVNTVDLYTPNARFTPERLGYQVLTLFGKLGYSRFFRKLLKGQECTPERLVTDKLSSDRAAAPSCGWRIRKNSIWFLSRMYARRVSPLSV